MIHSMTAYASRTGALGAVSWHWDMRGVNARGLDLRLRLPDGCDAVERALRAALTKALGRGNVTVTLRLQRDEAQADLSIDDQQLDRVLRALDRVQERAVTLGVTLAQPTAADVLAQRGVMGTSGGEVDDSALTAALITDTAPLFADFIQMRASEGAALQEVIADQLDQIADLTGQAASAAADRAPQVRAHLTAAVKRVLEDVDNIDEARIAQELALLAVKSDVTEEIDRLGAHVAAARALLAEDGPTGRKLDFLAQEFNREANTLCSKAQSAPLTSIGLALKAVIDQMREQIQNVE